MNGRKWLILPLMAISLMLTACSNSKAVNIETSAHIEAVTERDTNTATKETETDDTQKEDKMEINKANNASGNLPEILEVPVNTQREEVSLQSKDIDPLRAIHRCVSNGEKIFFAYNEPDVYVMPVGADKQTPLQIKNPEGLMVSNIAMDCYGGLHLLMVAQEYEEWYIWCLDEDYQVERIIDISAYFETKQIPMWFLIDKDGTFYLQWSLNRNGIILDKEGVMTHKTTPEALGVAWIYEAAVGKDGQIYLVYKDNDNLEIGALDVENGSIRSENSSLSFPGNETFSAMAAGTDTNLLIFSPNSGVWAYDNEKGMLENRVALSDIHIGENMEYWPLNFLPDGRLLLLGKTINSELTKPVELLMQYIPVGR